MKKRKLGIVVDSTIGGNFGKNIFPDLSIVHLTIILDNQICYEKDLDNKTFLKLSQEGKKFTTSQPNPQLFLKAFQEQFNLGYEHVACITLAQQLSGTFNSAQKAKQLLDNPKITIIDSGSVGPGMLFTLKKIQNQIQKNIAIDNYPEFFKKLKEEQEMGKILFTLNNLKQLITSKRISKIKSFIGQLFKIKPIIKLQKGIISVEKHFRSWNNGFKYLINQILQEQKEKGTIEIQIVYVDDEYFAQEFKKEIEQLKNPNIKCYIYGTISPIIAIHLSSRGFGLYINKI
ncbi:EDD domain protein [Candidatus Phytoplasma phoenicium]|uniref:EDD domain protein n=1 Tax=Candidatus Phytoplasma phoenicium TaxID=198422 RepID=A0A2S8NV60_9MOLU|nr:EDD domain protein [Candidatus Phytoplasma phoenicium]